MAVVDVQVDEQGIAVVTMNRPEALNALNAETLDALQAAIEKLDEDGARGIIVTGSGKAFVAGADIAQMASMGKDQAEAFSAKGQEAFDTLSAFPGPVMAAVNGFALGGGCELALACDVLVGSDKAVLGQPEVLLGVVPGFGGSQRLPRRVGIGHAKWLLMSGEKVKADEALRIGLLDKVVPADQLMAECKRMMAVMLENGPVAVRLVKELVDEGAGLVLDDALDLEVRGFGMAFETKDQKEGMKAFLEKRKAKWVGE